MLMTREIPCSDLPGLPGFASVWLSCPPTKDAPARLTPVKPALPLSTVSRETSQTATTPVLLPSCSHDRLVLNKRAISYIRDILLPGINIHPVGVIVGSCRIERGLQGIFSRGRVRMVTPQRHGGTPPVDQPSFTGHCQPRDPVAGLRPVNKPLPTAPPRGGLTSNMLFLQPLRGKSFAGRLSDTISKIEPCTRAHALPEMCAKWTCNIQSALSVTFLILVDADDHLPAY
ncbi:hypothetical protein GE09DRAFT_202769 [Coniochaeta sp. 2T2.1]|nr:hypothetical protein GE09DRAFT_202769 [Coniochaeta sp. 2T2.1]